MTADQIRKSYAMGDTPAMREIAAQLAELNVTMLNVLSSTQDIANLFSHSYNCPACNCHGPDDEDLRVIELPPNREDMD